MLKRHVLKKLQKYVKKYFVKHPEVKLVVVAGSVGKTSTKRALASLLVQRYRVRMQEGNHNAELSVPMAILGIDMPKNLRNPFAWWGVFKAARLRIRRPTDVDVIVQELGTDSPGDMAAFGSYLQPDIALLTAITPEHMEFFKTIDAVAQEEMTVASYAKYVLINRDDIDARFADFETNPHFSTYGTTGAAEFHFEQQRYDPGVGYAGVMYPSNQAEFPATIRVNGEHSLRPVIGAVAAAITMGLTADDVTRGLTLIKPVPGRMNVLRGIDGTTVIDDTYNSSPAAAEAALRSLYDYADAPQRIAVLGDMRELGEASEAAHRKLGEMCDSNLLAWVVTVGPESARYLAPAARLRGCQVKSFKNAIHAGQFVRSVTESGAVILVKGSQNEIYLEECVKILCDMDEDIELVRQSPEWIAKKNAFFSRYA